MSDDNIHPPIFTWVANNLSWLIPLVVAVCGGIWYWIQRMVFDPLKAHKKTLDSILRVIPPTAIEKKLVLQTVNDCSETRNACSIHTVVEELGTDIKTILTNQTVGNRRIVMAVTTLANRLPLKPEDREEVLKDLLP